MKKIRVMFVVLQLDAGGSERVVYDLAKNLDREKFEVYLVAFMGGVLAEPLRAICKEVVFVDKKPGFDLGAMLQLARLVRQFNIDVVNAHHYMPCFYSFLGTRLLNSRRLVYTEHSVPEVESVAGSFHGKLFNLMLYRMTAVVGVSHAITEKFRELYPRHRAKFHEILNGVDIEKFRNKGNRDLVRSRWGLGSDHFVVGTVANFRRVKNHVCLVRAAARLKESHPQLRLMMVGTGFPGDAENSEPEVRALVRELGLEDRVVFAGYQEDIPAMLSAFDAFCLPSFSEGLPVSVLEAMAAGVPVIGSAVSGIEEVVNNEINGRLFISNDIPHLSEAIREIFDCADKVNLFKENGRRLIENKYSESNFINCYSLIFSLSNH